MKFHPSSFQTTLMTSGDEEDKAINTLLNLISNNGKVKHYESTGGDTPLTLQINSSGNVSIMHQQHNGRFVRASSPLPIPSCSSNVIDYDLSDEVEEKKKYELSTWKMYHRITSARQKRDRTSPERKIMSSTSSRTNLPSFPKLPKSRKESTDSLSEPPKEIFPIEI